MGPSRSSLVCAKERNEGKRLIFAQSWQKDQQEVEENSNQIHIFSFPCFDDNCTSWKCLSRWKFSFQNGCTMCHMQKWRETKEEWPNGNTFFASLILLLYLTFAKKDYEIKPKESEQWEVLIEFFMFLRLHFSHQAKKETFLPFFTKEFSRFAPEKQLDFSALILNCQVVLEEETLTTTKPNRSAKNCTGYKSF